MEVYYLQLHHHALGCKLAKKVPHDLEFFCPKIQSGPENIKKSRPKKLVKSNNQFHEFFLDQMPFFAISKMAKNGFLN